MVAIESLRTPDGRFAGLPGYDFAPNYLESFPGLGSLRMHYLDEGPRDAAHTFLCLHGEPTWSYLYRKMIPVFTESGHRVIAPDLFGFGRSDKPVDDGYYSFDFHRGSLLHLIEALQLRALTLVVQDWGGLLGLTLPMDLHGRVEGLLLMNTALALGEPPSDGFVAWRDYARTQPDLDVGALMKRAVPELSDAEVAAYDAPFPDKRHKAGARSFPQLVPTEPGAPGAATARRAADWLRDHWRGRTFMAVGMRDPVLGPPVMKVLRRRIPGCPAPLELAEAGHFVQEQGEPVARAALDAFGF